MSSDATHGDSDTCAVHSERARMLDKQSDVNKTVKAYETNKQADATVTCIMLESNKRTNPGRRSRRSGATLPTLDTLYTDFSLTLFLSQHQFGAAHKKKDGFKGLW